MKNLSRGEGEGGGGTDLRDTARGRRDADQRELAQLLVVCRHLTLTLQHLDLDLNA